MEARSPPPGGEKHEKLGHFEITSAAAPHDSPDVGHDSGKWGTIPLGVSARQLHVFAGRRGDLASGIALSVAKDAGKNNYLRPSTLSHACFIASCP